MRAPYEFIVKPVGDRYSNKIKIGSNELILNSNIENHKFVNVIAEVLSTPLNLKTDVKPGDLLLVHHNVLDVSMTLEATKKILSPILWMVNTLLL